MLPKWKIILAQAVYCISTALTIWFVVAVWPLPGVFAHYEDMWRKAQNGQLTVGTAVDSSVDQINHFATNPIVQIFSIVVLAWAAWSLHSSIKASKRNGRQSGPPA